VIGVRSLWGWGRGGWGMGINQLVYWLSKGI